MVNGRAAGPEAAVRRQVDHHAGKEGPITGSQGAEGSSADREQDAMNMPAELCMYDARGPSWWWCWYQERNFNIIHEARDSTKWITEIKWCVLRGSKWAEPLFLARRLRRTDGLIAIANPCLLRLFLLLVHRPPIPP